MKESVVWMNVTLTFEVHENVWT